MIVLRKRDGNEKKEQMSEGQGKRRGGRSLLNGRRLLSDCRRVGWIVLLKSFSSLSFGVNGETKFKKKKEG